MLYYKLRESNLAELLPVRLRLRVVAAAIGAKHEFQRPTGPSICRSTTRGVETALRNTDWRPTTST